MTDPIEKFDLAVPEADLDDLRERLARTRWPERETVTDNEQGPQLARVQALVDHWHDAYDWRTCEAWLNEAGQYKTTIDGLGIHFLHVRSPQADAMPLLLCHGWPGSVLEFRKLVGPLADPAAYGGDPADAFHLVIPSMPSFGFSDKPRAPGWTPPRIARAWIELMGRLGYERWGVQGGDLGAAVADEIARLRPDPLIGVHSNFAMFKPDEEEMAAATPEERAMLADAGYFWEKLSGYAKEQGTRPQTIGYSLADSPVGLAAWIYAMFQDTCGTPGDAEGSFERDELLDDIMLYWLPNTGASAARLYWAMEASGWRPTATVEDPIEVPYGFTMLPREHVRKSRRWIERRYPNLVHFNEAEAGGHFAALEQPEVMIADIRATFRALR